MKRMGLIGVLAAASLVAGCIMFPPKNPQPAHPGPSPEAVAEANPPQASLGPPTAQQPPAPPSEDANACHVELYQSLIGQPIDAVDRTTLPTHRVICAGCMATMDFVAERLTIQLDQDDKIDSLRCG